MVNQDVSDTRTSLLIVSPDPVDRAHWHARLDDLGYCVVAAEDLPTAQGLFAESPFDLVIVGGGCAVETRLESARSLMPFARSASALLLLDDDDPLPNAQQPGTPLIDILRLPAADADIRYRIEFLLGLTTRGLANGQLPQAGNGQTPPNPPAISDPLGQNRLFIEMAESAPVMMWTADPSGRCTYANLAWLEFAGRTLEEDLFDGWEDTIHPDDRERYLRERRADMDQHDRFVGECRVRRGDGAYCLTRHSAVAHRTSDGTLLGYSGFVVDLSEQQRVKDAYSVSSQRLEAIINAAPFAIVTTRLDGTIESWNAAAKRIFGWRSDDVVGRNITTDILDASSAERVLTYSKVTDFEDVELLCYHKDGRLVDISATAVPLYDSVGEIDYVLAVAQDITGRKQAEASERESRALTEVMRDIGQALSSTLDLDRLMALILENVQRVVPHDAATIIQFKDGFGHVTHMRGYPAEIAERVGTFDFTLEQPTMRAMLNSAMPFYVADVQNDPNWLLMDELLWIRSYCGISLRVQGEVIAFLNLDSSRINGFTQDHLDRLQAFTAQASIAIENARLYDNIRRDAVELNLLQRATSFLFSNHLFTQNGLEEVGLQIARTVVNEFGQIDCGLMLLDEARTQLRRVARTGAYSVQPNKPLYLNGQGLVPAAARSGQVIYAPDVREDSRYLANVGSTRSELVLPLKTSKGVIGVLDLQSTQLDAFNEQNRRILQSFAEQAAVAIENIQLYDQVRRYSSELETRVGERTAELVRVKERVEAILNNSSDAIVMARADGSIQQTNRAFDRLFHYDVDDSFGKPLSVLARLDYVDMLEAALKQAVEGNRAVRIEMMAVTTHGNFFDADVMVSPVQEREQTVSSVVCSVRDITTRKRIEQELRRALQRERELSDLKSRFISTASHEFRTPLAMIMTSSDLLLTYGDRLNDSQKHQRLEKIQLEVKNITSLLDDLLTISRASQTGKLEYNPTQIDLPATCLQILQEIRTGMGSGHEFRVSMTGDERTAWIDSKLLKRMLTNLLSNAIKYSPRGSTIEFELRCDAEEKVIRISDQGIGIPEADRKNLFEAFHRGRNVGNVAGTGLGLAIVKNAVDMHSGTIDLDSRVDVGTTFTLTFPVVLPKEDIYEENSGH